MESCVTKEAPSGRTDGGVRATFIVRMWKEIPDADMPEWRGTVEHAQSGERRAVVGADGLLDLLAVWLMEEFE